MATTKKTASVRITTSAGGGVNYVPPDKVGSGEDPLILAHGETHEVDQDFARMLIHQKRAVLADPTQVLDTPALTSDMLAPDPVVAPRRTRA